MKHTMESEARKIESMHNRVLDSFEIGSREQRLCNRYYAVVKRYESRYNTPWYEVIKA